MLRLFSLMGISLCLACATPQPAPLPIVPKPVEVPSKPLVDLTSPLAKDQELVFELPVEKITVADIGADPIPMPSENNCLIISDNNTYLHNAQQVSDFLKENLKQKWIKPANINRKYQCFVSLHIAESGCVSDIEINGCRDNKQLVRSIETALFRSAPFPGINKDLQGDNVQFEFFAGP